MHVDYRRQDIKKPVRLRITCSSAQRVDRAGELRKVGEEVTMSNHAWVDFRSVKETVSMEMVLNRYNVRLRKVNATYLRGKCPLPSHTSKGSDDSFGVDTTKNAWACQSDSCVKSRSGKKGGNVLDFVSVMEGCSVRDAAIKIADWFNIAHATPGSSVHQPQATSDRQKLVAEKKREGEADSAPVVEENTPLAFTLKHIDCSHAFIVQRGITNETAETFGCGFFSGKGSMAGRVVIPIHNVAGELVAYAGRAIDGTEPRYRLPANFQKSLELFNLHRAIAGGTDCVIVVEGFFGCMHVHQAGYRNVVGLMGSSLSNAQEDKLAEHFSRVVIMLDGDDVGRGAAADIATRLVRRRFTRVVDLPSGKQPDELSADDLKSILGSL